MGASERRKGAAAEREAYAWWCDRVGADMVVRRRASDQSADGGWDLMVRGHPALYVEVKRTEKATPMRWLDQAQAATPDGGIAVVMWRPSRRDWCFVVEGDGMATLVREGM